MSRKQGLGKVAFVSQDWFLERDHKIYISNSHKAKYSKNPTLTNPLQMPSSTATTSAERIKLALAWGLSVCKMSDRNYIEKNEGWIVSE